MFSATKTFQPPLPLSPSVSPCLSLCLSLCLASPPPKQPPLNATFSPGTSQEALGLLDSPVPALQSPLLRRVGGKEDHEAALQAARESITLLKNGDMPTRSGGEGEGVTVEEEDAVVTVVPKALPLDRSRVGKLLVVGPACDSLPLQSGGWTKHWQVW